MICQTPHCDTHAPDDELDRRFCERCGWPLCMGQISLEPEVVPVLGDMLTQVKLRIDNLGMGYLPWEIVDLPKGLTATERPKEALPFSSTTMNFSVNPADLPEGAQFPITIRLWDRHGKAGFDLRTGAPEEFWRDETVYLQFKKQQYGPLETHWRSLLFGGAVVSAGLTVRNLGDADLVVTARVTSGYRIQISGQPLQEQVTATVPGKFDWDVTVYRDMSVPAQEGTLTFETPKKEPLVVRLQPVRITPFSPPKEQWVIAIDFGTTKSAVAVFEQRRRGAEPTLIPWPQPGGSESCDWLPSVVRWQGEKPTQFGWSIPRFESGPDIYRSLKMHLREDDPRIKESIQFFLRQIFNRIAAQHPQEIYNDARLVFTLPVLENDTAKQEQKKRTLEYALAAGRGYKLREDQCSFYYEPETAAIDFLHYIEQEVESGAMPALPKPGEWLCVLDMGGGTTDVAFAKFELTADNKPAFNVIYSLGFPGFAGDRIDVELYRWSIRYWIKNKRLKGIAGDSRPLEELLKDESLEELIQADTLALEGDDVSRKVALEQISQHKEEMYATPVPQNQVWDYFTYKENYVTFTPEQIDTDVLADLARQMFQMGVKSADPSRPDLPSVSRKLDEWEEVTPSAIRFLCLTGGTSQIPYFEKAFREMVLYSGTPQRVVTPGTHRLNVVRGAARLPGARLGGRLLCPVVVNWITPDRRETQEALQVGAMPGAEKALLQYVPFETTLTVELGMQLPGQETEILYSYSVKHPSLDPEGTDLKVQIQYLPHHLLRLRLAWNTTPEEVIQDWVAIQTLPAA